MIPQGLKPACFQALAARLKPCPTQNQFVRPILVGYSTMSFPKKQCLVSLDAVRADAHGVGTGFTNGLASRVPNPQGLKPALLAGLSGTAEQFAEKVRIQQPAPEGAIDFERLAVSLKRYPDTNPGFSANCEAAPHPKPTCETRSGQTKNCLQRIGAFALISGLLGWIVVAGLLAGSASAQWNPLNPVQSVQQKADGAEFTLKSGTLRLQVCSDSVIHVIYSPASPVAAAKNLVIVKESWPA